MADEVSLSPLLAEDAMSYVPPASRARDLAYSGVFGAAALLLPTLFHLVHLGYVFMPMYLPLMTLAFLVRPAHAGMTALLVPLISAFSTGMPPLYPPVAFCMSLELSIMALSIAFLRSRFPRWPVLSLLVPVLLFGRLVYVGLAWTCAHFMDLPARFVAGLSLLSGWPGILLMLGVLPGMVAILQVKNPNPISSE